MSKSVFVCLSGLTFQSNFNAVVPRMAFLNVCSVIVFYVFCVVLCVGFCRGHFAMVPLNLTYLHCLQHSFVEHLFILYLVKAIRVLNDIDLQYLHVCIVHLC